MMTIKRMTVIAALTLAPATATMAQAQTHRAHIGPRVGYNLDSESALLGFQVSLPLARFLELYPSYDYYFTDGPGSLMAFNVDLKYRFSGQGWSWLYAGGGLGIMRFSGGGASNTDTGANLMVGLESLRGLIHPFAEFRILLNDGSSAQLMGGLNFTLGR